jgi:hypothetical protein
MMRQRDRPDLDAAVNLALANSSDVKMATVRQRDQLTHFPPNARVTTPWWSLR